MTEAAILVAILKVIVADAPEAYSALKAVLDAYDKYKTGDVAALKDIAAKCLTGPEALAASEAMDDVAAKLALDAKFADVVETPTPAADTEPTKP